KEVWPEGEPFYADYQDKPAPALPAVRVQEINQMLGLQAA
ncbi:MAG: Nmad5 family putative nucleotide modification protein, partial [Mesorhizobium sp.]